MAERYQVTRSWVVEASNLDEALLAAKPGEHSDVHVQKLRVLCSRCGEELESVSRRQESGS